MILYAQHHAAIALLVASEKACILEDFGDEEGLVSHSGAISVMNIM